MFVDKDGKPMLTEDESKEMILFEPARLFCFMVEVFDLKEKALRGEVAFAITGDAATVCTGGNEAGQCLFGLKPIDKDAKHPLSAMSMLCQPVDDDDAVIKQPFSPSQFVSMEWGLRKDGFEADMEVPPDEPPRTSSSKARSRR